ncbi:MAG: cysteine dioxygenase type family protein [Hyphomicrobiales bacterium]|nr:cysteine dioxygenase type family protein [Hyphomicrobiales bacterium]
MVILQDADHTELFAHLSATSLASGAEYLKAGREALVRLLADPSFLDGVKLERIPGAYTRNLVFGDERIAVYAIVWSAGSQTSIHDHHCSCCFAILSGALQESWYEPVDKTHGVASKTFTRAAGEIACMLPTGPNLHKMLNASDQEAISIHIYGYDHRTRASSIDCEYLALEER